MCDGCIAGGERWIVGEGGIKIRWVLWVRACQSPTPRTEGRKCDGMVMRRILPSRLVQHLSVTRERELPWIVPALGTGRIWHLPDT